MGLVRKVAGPGLLLREVFLGSDCGTVTSASEFTIRVSLGNFNLA
jgi:hypothetical protein